MKSSYPWPLSEVTPEVAEQILAIQQPFRDKRITRLKAELARKEQERRRRAMGPSA